MAQFRKQIAIIKGNLFDFLHNGCMLSALIRIEPKKVNHGARSGSKYR